MWKLVCSLINSLVWWEVFFLKEIAGDGTIELTLTSYKNENHYLKENECCKKSESSTCREDCDNVFDVCITDKKSASAASPVECSYGNFTSRTISNDAFDFQDLRNTKMNESLKFPFKNEWPRNITVLVNVHIEGKKEIVTFKIEENDAPASFNNRMMTNFTKVHGEIPSYRKEIKGNISIYCDKGYVPPYCIKPCTPHDNHTGHYNCTKTGNKVCLHGWKNVSSNCTKREMITSPSTTLISASTTYTSHLNEFSQTSSLKATRSSLLSTTTTILHSSMASSSSLNVKVKVTQSKVTAAPTSKVKPTPTSKVSAAPTSKVKPTPTPKVSASPTSKVKPTQSKVSASPTFKVIPTQSTTRTILPNSIVGVNSIPSHKVIPTSTSKKSTTVLSTSTKVVVTCQTETSSTQGPLEANLLNITLGGGALVIIMSLVICLVYQRRWYQDQLKRQNDRFKKFKLSYVNEAYGELYNSNSNNRNNFYEEIWNFDQLKTNL